MNNFHIKNIILGLGIGIILTSTTSIIYLAGTPAVREPSNEEIIQRAKSLGMVEAQLISDTKNQEENTDTNVNPGTAENKNIDTDTQKNNEESQQSPADKVKVISIKPGDTSEIVADNLFENKAIKNRDDFLNTLNQLGLEGEIRAGDFQIKEGMDLKSIIEIITGRD